MFHPAVFIVVLRWCARNDLMFGVMPQKIPGVWGQSPQAAWYRIRKLSDFRIGSLAFPLDGRFSRGREQGAGGMRVRRALDDVLSGLLRYNHEQGWDDSFRTPCSSQNTNCACSPTSPPWSPLIPCDEKGTKEQSELCSEHHTTGLRFSLRLCFFA